MLSASIASRNAKTKSRACDMLGICTARYRGVKVVHIKVNVQVAG